MPRTARKPASPASAKPIDMTPFSAPPARRVKVEDVLRLAVVADEDGDASLARALYTVAGRMDRGCGGSNGFDFEEWASYAHARGLKRAARWLARFDNALPPARTARREAQTDEATRPVRPGPATSKRSACPTAPAGSSLFDVFAEAKKDE